MLPTEPLALHHSWSLFNACDHMRLDGQVPFSVEAPTLGADTLLLCDLLARRGAGIWECDLATEKLSWSAGVFDLFGIPRDEPATRPLALSLYLPEARRSMEMLRTYAVRRRRGFTIDLQIRRPDGDVRWMRLSAMPVLEGPRVTRLRGIKQDVTALYDGPRVRIPAELRPLG